MKDIVWFKDIDKTSIAIAGGKGASLGEMYNNGFQVPPGFCVTAYAYANFVKAVQPQIEKLLSTLHIEDTKQLQEIAEQIQNLIKNQKISPDLKEKIINSYEILGSEGNAHDLVEANEVFVAVRSSATAEDLPDASFAGQQATYLNVKGKDNVIMAVRDCWASLFTARAIYYREKKNFDHTKILISAVIQKMVNSEQSGIMFTINPATNKEDEIVIEAVYGLGETIVGGQVNPDLYIIDKNTRKITTTEVKKQEWGLFRNEQGENEKRDIEESLKERQKIPDSIVQELARLGKNIETHYDFPQDIEFAVEKNQIYLVQSRPVTTFTPQKKEEAPKNVILHGETASSGTHTGVVKIVNSPRDVDKVEQGDILVTIMTSSELKEAVQKAGAIVTDEGGMTSHAAVISRELGTPCIVGTEHGTQTLQEGQTVTVDASYGAVYGGEKELTTDTSHTTVNLIVNVPDLAVEAAASGADEVGLVRIEMLVASKGMHPAEYIRQGKEQEYIALLKGNISAIAKAFGGKKVLVRCSDMRTDEYRNLQGGSEEPTEADPMLGWHGIRRLLDDEKMLRAEFQAIRELHYDGYKNIGVILPFVTKVDEVMKAKQILSEIGLEPGKAIDFGIMIETPAACWIIDDLCKAGLNFVCLGINDLAQLTLGVDRNNQKVKGLFDEMHPSILSEIAKVIKSCRKHKVRTSICSHAASTTEMTEFAVHQGIDTITTNVDTIDEIKSVVLRTERKVLNSK
jgi:pyruvate, water dikinase